MISLLTIDDVANRLGVTPRYVRRLVAERRIPFVSADTSFGLRVATSRLGSATAGLKSVSAGPGLVAASERRRRALPPPR
jgi:hypothetical protein